MTRGPFLYDYWRSSASYRVRIALHLKRIRFEALAVNLLTGDHRRADHLARNSQGTVPVLEIDQDRLTNRRIECHLSVAILA